MLNSRTTGTATMPPVPTGSSAGTSTVITIPGTMNLWWKLEELPEAPLLPTAGRRVLPTTCTPMTSFDIAVLMDGRVVILDMWTYCDGPLTPCEASSPGSRSVIRAPEVLRRHHQIHRNLRSCKDAGLTRIDQRCFSDDTQPAIHLGVPVICALPILHTNPLANANAHATDPHANPHASATQRESSQRKA